MKKYKNLKTKLIKALASFTLAKFCGAIFTVTLLAIVKYIISGNFHIEYCDFWNNIGIGLLGWTINTGIIGLLTEYLGIKGINFNLYQFLFGFESMKVSDTINVGKISSNTYALEDGKPKLYNAMDSGEGSSSVKKSGSKGGSRQRTLMSRGADGRLHPYPANGRRMVRRWTFDDESEKASNNGSDTEMEGVTSNKGNGSDTEMEGVVFKDKLVSSASPSELPLDKGKGIEATNTSQEPHLPIWTRPFSGLDPNLVIFKPKINPGPGFTEEVSMQGPIGKYLNYNGHFLTQFKNMDWNTAMQQRYNYLLCAHNMDFKIAFVENKLKEVPTIPTNEYEFKLRNQLLKDLEDLNRVKAQSEARAALLYSRIKYIENVCNNNNNNNNNN